MQANKVGVLRNFSLNVGMKCLHILSKNKKEVLFADMNLLENLLVPFLPWYPLLKFPSG